MLDPENIWISEFKKITPSATPIEGIIKLADTIESMTNKVEPNLPAASISPGIFKWAKPIFVAQVMAIVPTQLPDWIQKVASAWQAACMGAVITPGLVSNPSQWTVSTVDVNTLPAAVTTIPTIAAGQAALVAGLSSMPALVKTSPPASQEAFAKAFRAAVAAFSFNLIGIAGTTASPSPLPLVVPAK